MALLGVNDDVTIPGVVVCVHVSTITTPDKLNPQKKYHTLRCWSAVAFRIEDYKCTREKIRQGKDSDEFWNWLNAVRLIHRPVWLFAANLQVTLTVLGLWTLMESGCFSLHRRAPQNLIQFRKRRGDREPDKVVPGFLVTNSPPTVAVFYHKSGWKVIALSVENYLSESTAQHVDGTPPEACTVPAMTAPLANWLQHCTDQAAQLKERVADLICWHKRQELGRFAFTISGIALAGFRHRFMTHHIYCPDDQTDRDREREAYYPGRVEAFWVGTVADNRYTPVESAPPELDLFGSWPKPPFYLLDARSFYGAVGAFCELPYRHRESSPETGDCHEPTSGRMVEYLACVEVATADDVYPVRHAGRVWYARGNFRTVLAGPELSRAYQRGHVKRWLWWRRYHLDVIFQSYSLALWAERERLQKGGSLTACNCVKSLLARLHGKFLQRKSAWEARPKMYAPYPWAQWSVASATTGEARKFRAIGWDVEEEVDGGDTPYCFPAIAAWVTSYGREWLNSWISFAGKENVLYVATDSLIVTEVGRRRLEDRGIVYPGGIGSLRVCERTDSLAIEAANNYRFGKRRKVAGRSSRFVGVVPSPQAGERFESLTTILHARRGASCASVTDTGDFSRPERWLRILPGGWVSTPVVRLEAQ